MDAFSPHAGALAESETLAITASARQLMSRGLDVAPFAAGEPDFDTPAAIREAGIVAIREGRTRYAPAAGIAPLREAVATHLGENGFEGLSVDQTLVSTGAKGILYLALMVLLRDGDEVIVPSPAWLSYAKMVQAAGGRCVFVPASASAGYAIDPKAIEAAITDRTRAILINSPGNPTGAVQTDAVMATIGRLATQHDLYVISDEIYEHLVYPPARFHSFVAAAPEARDRTLVVNGVSKAYAMTGWRIGYCGGPKAWVQRMIRLQSHAFSGPPEICQRAALAALEGSLDDVLGMRTAFGERRLLMVEGLRAMDGISVPVVPDGAFYVLPDVTPLLARRFQGEPIGSVARLAALLLEHAHAAVVPGHVFEAPTTLRFSYACSRKQIEAGLARVADFVHELT